MFVDDPWWEGNVNEGTADPETARVEGAGLIVKVDIRDGCGSMMEGSRPTGRDDLRMMKVVSWKENMVGPCVQVGGKKNVCINVSLQLKWKLLSVGGRRPCGGNGVGIVVWVHASSGSCGNRLLTG